MADTPFRNHCCVAEFTFDPVPDPKALRQAIVDSAATLPNFSFPPARDEATLSIHYHTQLLKYLDRITVDLQLTGGVMRAQSNSSNLCPTVKPCGWFSCCCSWFKGYTDSGQNEMHLTQLSEALQSRLPHRFDVVYSSRPKPK